MKRIATFAAACLLLAGCQDVTHPTPAETLAGDPRADHIDYQEPAVVIDGETYIYVEDDSNWQYHTWTALVSGGEAPYTYSWEIRYDNLGPSWGSLGSTSDSVTFGVTSGDGSFDLRVTVTDKWGHTATSIRHVTVSGASCGFAIYC